MHNIIYTMSISRRKLQVLGQSLSGLIFFQKGGRGETGVPRLCRSVETSKPMVISKANIPMVKSPIRWCSFQWWILGAWSFSTDWSNGLLDILGRSERKQQQIYKMMLRLFGVLPASIEHYFFLFWGKLFITLDLLIYDDSAHDHFFFLGGGVVGLRKNSISSKLPRYALDGRWSSLGWKTVQAEMDSQGCAVLVTFGSGDFDD